MSDAEASRRFSGPWRDWAARLSFRAKLGLMVKLLMIILILGAVLLVEHRQRTAIIQEVEKRTLLMAQALGSATAADLVTYNYISIEQTLQKFSKQPDLVYAVILDKEGTVAAQFLRDYPVQTLLDQRVDRRAPGDITIDQVYVPGTERETLYDVNWPVTVADSPERWGTIRLGISLKAMHEEIARTRWQIALFGLIALVIGSLSSVILAQRITKPLRALTKGVAAVGQGDLTQRIDIQTKDELGELAHAFNEMAAQLARIRELEERLRRADRLAALGTMAAGIAHDIRNPLTSILIFSQLMSLHHDDPEVRQKFDRVVPRELERVQSVIEDMMELARPATLHLEETNLNEVLAQVVELFENQAATQGVKLSREFGPDLPPCMADRRRLHRAFSNLVANGIQAMIPGGDLYVRTSLVHPARSPELQASLSGLQAPIEAALQVIIRDTGQGISQERLSRIFDPFYTTKEKGLGLGMAITHRIIEDHKGMIDVQSQVGLGTTFTIHLPVSL